MDSKSQSWQRCELGQLAYLHKDQVNPADLGESLVHHHSIPAFDEGQVPKHESAMTIKSIKSRVPADAVLLSKLNPRFPRVWMPRIDPTVESLASTEFIILRPQANTDRRFLKYLCSAPVFLARLLERVTGTSSSHQRVRPDDVLTIEVDTPPLPEQHAIAHILGTLDDKIERNCRMNQTLEAMAQALFKSWFVDFEPFRDEGMQDSPLGEIPLGWEVKVLDDLTDFVVGGDWGKDSLQEDYTEPTQCIRGADIPDIQRGGIGKMPIRYLKPSSLETRSLQVGDVVIEISGGSPTQSTGRAVLITAQLLSRLAYPLICSNFCRLVRLSPGITPRILYFWLRWLYDSDVFLQYETGTTGIKNFAYTIFGGTHYLAVPPSETLDAFDTLVQPLLDQHANNGLESETLAAIRDALLPKLLSGEIRVKDAEKFVEAR